MCIRDRNRARQDAITTEIMEIVSGAEALGSDDKSASQNDIEEPVAAGVEA